MCPHSCAGVGELTRRRPVTPLLFAARGTPKWSLPARAGLQRQSPTLGSARSSVEAPRLSHRSLSIPVLPAGQGLASRESPFVPARSPSHFPTKPTSFPHRSGKEASTQEKRDARRAPPGAGPQSGARRWPAGWVPGWGAWQTRHPLFLQRRHLAAAALQEGDPAAPILPLPRAPRVRAPGLQMLPGWRHQDFRAAPPSPAATLRSLHLESSWRLGCRIQDWAPPLRAGLPSLRAAAQRPHFPPASCTHLFLWTMGFSNCTRAFSHRHGLLEDPAGGRSRGTGTLLKHFPGCQYSTFTSRPPSLTVGEA